MRCRRDDGRERAVMLIEVLVYMAASMIVLLCAFSAFYRADEQSRALSRHADDILKVMRAGEHWRADMRAAMAAPELTEFADAVLLRIRQRDGEVVYAFKQGAVSRESAGRFQLLLSGVQSCAFVLDQREHVTAWRWEVELGPRRKSPRLKPLFTFTAVPAKGTR